MSVLTCRLAAGQQGKQLMMDLETVKRNLEKGYYLSEDEDDHNNNNIRSTIEAMPFGSFELFLVQGLAVDLIQPGHLICSMKLHPRLLNSEGNFLHGGAIAALIGSVGHAAIYTVTAKKPAVTLDLNISYLDAAYLHDEIEIDARVVRVGKSIGVVSVDIKKKGTRKIVAQGRHTSYLAIASKM